MLTTTTDSTSRTAKRLVTAFVGGLVLAAAPLGMAVASPGSPPSTLHSSFDPTGTVFVCAGGDLTFLPGGTADQVIHNSVDSNGVIHITGTVTLHNVTASDADGNVYPITGATWFGAKGTQDQTYLAHDTDHFVVHNAAGGVYAKVQVTDHFSLNGPVFTLDFGSCEAPQG